MRHYNMLYYPQLVNTIRMKNRARRPFEATGFAPVPAAVINKPDIVTVNCNNLQAFLPFSAPLGTPFRGDPR